MGVPPECLPTFHNSCGLISNPVFIWGGGCKPAITAIQVSKMAIHWVLGVALIKNLRQIIAILNETRRKEIIAIQRDQISLST
jgi:hypothetical protein